MESSHADMVIPFLSPWHITTFCQDLTENDFQEVVLHSFVTMLHGNEKQLHKQVRKEMWSMEHPVAHSTMHHFPDFQMLRNQKAVCFSLK